MSLKGCVIILLEITEYMNFDHRFVEVISRGLLSRCIVLPSKLVCKKVRKSGRTDGKPAPNKTFNIWTHSKSIGLLYDLSMLHIALYL